MANKKILTRNLLKKERILEIDFFRGLPIFLVVLFHFAWSFAFIITSFSNYFEVVKEYPNIYQFVRWLYNVVLSSDGIIHQYIVPLVGGLFIFICGVSTSFSKNNLKRAIQLDLVALLITVITGILYQFFDVDCYIDFGVIHLMGFSITIYALIELFFKKVLKSDVPFWVTYLISVVIFYFSIRRFSGYDIITNKFIDFWPIDHLRGLPSERYTSPLNYLYEMIGKYSGDTDWWPIFPYTGVIFLGISIGKVVYGKEKKTRLNFLKAYPFKPILFIGRHTIWVYLIHQPIIIAILFIIFSIMGFRI